MKVKLTCHCNESFNIESRNLRFKTDIICPNCSFQFPKDKFEDFKNSIVKLDEIQMSLFTRDENDCSVPTWRFDL